MLKFNTVIAQLTFWVVLWWGIFEWRFVSWSSAWPWLAASGALLWLWNHFADRLRDEGGKIA